MSNSNFLVDVLFRYPYPVMLLFALILLVSLGLLIIGRRNLPGLVRGVLAVLVGLSLLYFAAVVWLILASGSNAHPPVPKG